MPDKPKIVADIMTSEVVTLYEEENLEFLEAGMKKYGLRHLPVVDGGKLVGLITHRDLLRTAVSTLMPGGQEREMKYERSHFVSEIMTRDVKTVRANTPLTEAATLMRREKLGCLPVTDEEGMLVGIITESDFLELAVRLLSED